MRVGNQLELSDSMAFGEPSDWMLGKFGIISFSPELGDETNNSKTFYPEKNDILPILE